MKIKLSGLWREIYTQGYSLDISNGNKPKVENDRIIKELRHQKYSLIYLPWF